MPNAFFTALILISCASASVIVFLAISGKLPVFNRFATTVKSGFEKYGKSQIENLAAKYVANIEKQFSFLCYSVSARSFAIGHTIVFAGVLALALLKSNVSLLLLAPVIGVGPHWYVGRDVSKRRRKIDEQLPLWLSALANSLRTSSALADGIAESTKLVPVPLADELDLLLKNVQLGANVDQALQAMRKRVLSRNLDTAVATLVVARDTGGDLPKILEDTAAALHEMERLEGVLRTKTAESRSQGYLMGALPFGLCGVLHWIDPQWLGQLTQSGPGYVVIIISSVLWVASIFTARKVLAVSL